MDTDFFLQQKAHDKGASGLCAPGELHGEGANGSGAICTTVVLNLHEKDG